MRHAGGALDSNAIGDKPLRTSDPILRYHSHEVQIQSAAGVLDERDLRGGRRTPKRSEPET